MSAARMRVLPAILALLLLAIGAPGHAADSGAASPSAEAAPPAEAAAADGPSGDPVARRLHRLDAPWYDSHRDGWRRVELPKTKEEAAAEKAGDLSDFAPSSTGLGLGTVFAWLMWGLVALATVVLVVQVARMRGDWRRIDAGPTDRPGAPIAIGALPFQLPEHGGDLEAALRAACAAGDWSRAVIWLYAAQLLHLDRAGAIRLAPGKTNRAYQRELAADPPAAAAALGASIDAFERTYFGHQPADRALVDGLLARHRALLAALAPAGSPA